MCDDIDMELGGKKKDKQRMRLERKRGENLGVFS